jgi:hypothetical protein
MRTHVTCTHPSQTDQLVLNKDEHTHDRIDCRHSTNICVWARACVYVCSCMHECVTGIFWKTGTLLAKASIFIIKHDVKNMFLYHWKARGYIWLLFTGNIPSMYGWCDMPWDSVGVKVAQHRTFVKEWLWRKCRQFCKIYTGIYIWICDNSVITFAINMRSNYLCKPNTFFIQCFKHFVSCWTANIVANTSIKWPTWSWIDARWQTLRL